jgi:hypothetical protein
VTHWQLNAILNGTSAILNGAEWATQGLAISAFFTGLGLACFGISTIYVWYEL